MTKATSICIILHTTFGLIQHSRTSPYRHPALLRTVSNVPTKFSYIFFKKPSLIRTTDTESRPQLNPKSRSGESAQGESRLVWLVSYARWYKAQSLYTKQRFAKGVQRNITDFLKASITTDSIKIFSITFCTLVTVYCTCKIAKDAFRIVLYVTIFYM